MDSSKQNNGLTDEQFQEPKSSLLESNDEKCKIYLLKRIFSVGYDEFDGKVIVASNAKAARKIANMKYGDEGPIWTDVNQVLCKEITLDQPMVILESFKAG